jgi:PPK2 family polyphosphate:nucleotide phosphotransferase
MLNAPKSRYLVPFDGSFRIKDAPTASPKAKKDRDRKRLKDSNDKMDVLQQALYANDHHAVLLVFQGMDAAGKDSTIRAVMQGINPAGCQVYSFKKPSHQERDHDFLWRHARVMPERGRIGIFNRSHYEEVLIVRVHPEILDTQRLPNHIDRDMIWEQRYESIRDHEKHLARNGTVILKFWLNVSREEQRLRFLSRLDDEEKHWKFKPSDVRERAYWDDYMHAYEEALNATSRPWAPWYAIPADNKPFMRATIAEIVVAAMQAIGLTYPKPSAEDRAQFDASRKALTESDGQ